MKHTFRYAAIAILLLAALFLFAACAVPQLPRVSELPAPTSTPTPTHTPTNTPTPTPTPSPTPTSTPTPISTTTGPSTSAITPQATTAPEKLALIITEKEANRLAAEALAKQQDIAIDNLQVDFRPDELYISGDTVIGFFKLNIGILASITPLDGRPEVTIKEIYVNGERATGFIRDQIEAIIAPQLDQLATVSTDFYVEAITITDDRMIITGRYQ